jgi:Laminin EGF domain
MPPRHVLGLLLGLAALITHAPRLTGAQSAVPYGKRGEYFTATEMSVVLRAAKANIRAVASANQTSASVTLTSYTHAANPTYVPYAYIPFTEDEARYVKRFVSTHQQAFAECAAYFPCAAVHVFGLASSAATFYVALYYSDTSTSYGAAMFAYGSTIKMDQDANMQNWIATAFPDRYAGLECLTPTVDPVWFFRTWGYQFTDAFYDVSSVGVPGAGAVDSDILAYAGAISSYFLTVGHQFRLWPNARCPLTPVSLDPYAVPVASKTVAPLNFRHRIVALNAFAASPATQPEEIHDAPIASIDAVTGEVFLKSGFSFNYYSTLRFAPRVRGKAVTGPCGAGYLVHDTVHGGAVCRCPNPVANDHSCQFNVTNCIEPSTLHHCSNRPGAVCGFNRSAISWLADDPFSNAAVLQCSCPPPYVPPTCLHSACWRGPSRNNVDCLADNTATNCTGTERFTGVCKCRPGRLGTDCQIDDTLNRTCTIQSAGVEGLFSTTETLVCSGRGTCLFAGSPTSPTARPLGCNCSAGYMGRRCELFACSHMHNCGRYGTCLQSSDAYGRPQMSCQCARLRQDSSVAIAKFFDGLCEVADCGMGVIVIDQSVGPKDYRNPLLGHCECFQTTNPVIGAGWTNESDVAGVSSGNTGLVCDKPMCPTFVDASGVQLAGQCNVESEMAVPFICLPCARYSFYGICSQSLGFGGACDCDGSWAAAMSPGGINHPYWKLPTLSRWTFSDDLTNPMCVPYCLNGGQWNYNTLFNMGACTCDMHNVYIGERCNVHKCPHGTPAVYTNCTSTCDPGWAPNYQCDRCEAGYAGPDCATCAAGYYETPTGLCARCFIDPTVCNQRGTLNVACSASALGCICSTGYMGPSCSTCSSGYVVATKLTGGLAWPTVVCVNCTEYVNCVAGASLGAVCISGEAPRCVCKDATNMDPFSRCNCKTGSNKFLSQGACVSCNTFKACYGPGTKTCSANGCGCNSGFSGTKCDHCASGYVAVNAISGLQCMQCAAGVCGTYGTALCTTNTKTSQGCACFNGYSGDTCTTCSLCGVGGSCATTTGGAWCVCREGYAKPSVYPPGITSPIALPCSVCASGYLMVGGACVTVAAACGKSASPQASAAAGVCTCQAGFKMSPSGECLDCLAGYAGSKCAACMPTCKHAGNCVANGGAVFCACESAWDGLDCSACSDGYVGPSCAPCPQMGCVGGACAWNASVGSAVCRCSGLYLNEGGDATTPCSVCGPGGSPLTCQDCGALNCSAGSTCAETVVGRLSCECLPGFRRTLADTQNVSATRAPCYPLQVAVSLDAMDAASGMYAPPPTQLVSGAQYKVYAAGILGGALFLLGVVGALVGYTTSRGKH